MSLQNFKWNFKDCVSLLINQSTFSCTMSAVETAEIVPVLTVDLKLHAICDVTVLENCGFLRRSVETGLRRKTGLPRLKAGINDSPIGIGLGRNRVLNLVRLNQGGLSNVTAKEFQTESYRQSQDVYLFSETGKESQVSSPVIRDSVRDLICHELYGLVTLLEM